MNLAAGLPYLAIAPFLDLGGRADTVVARKRIRAIRGTTLWERKTEWRQKKNKKINNRRKQREPKMTWGIKFCVSGPKERVGRDKENEGVSGNEKVREGMLKLKKSNDTKLTIWKTNIVGIKK